MEAFEPGEPLKQRLSTFARKFDALGAALILFGTGMFTAGITLGPEEGWTSPITLPLIIIGVALIVVFGYWETKCAHPLMPPYIWKDRNFALLSECIPEPRVERASSCRPRRNCLSTSLTVSSTGATTVFGYMSFQASSFYLAFFMQEIRGYDPLSVAVHLLPQAIAGLLWNVLIGYTLHKVNNTLIIAVGSLSYLAANILLSLMRADSSYWAFMFPALILNVVGADFQTNVSNVSSAKASPTALKSLRRQCADVFADVCNAVPTSTPAGFSNRRTEHPQPLECNSRSGCCHSHIQLRRYDGPGNGPPDAEVHPDVRGVRWDGRSECAIRPVASAWDAGKSRQRYDACYRKERCSAGGRGWYEKRGSERRMKMAGILIYGHHMIDSV